MGKPRGNQRDGFTASGDGPRFDRVFKDADTPRFVPKHRNPPYLRPSIVRRSKKAPEGGDD